MQTFVILKDITNLPQDVAHFYEHWFIASFYAYAEKQIGWHAGSIGYIGGETYQNMLFVEAWFYNDKATELFREFLAAEQLDESQYASCMSQCQAEDRTLWTITNNSLLRQQLAELRGTAWRMDDDIEPFLYDATISELTSPIKTQPSAASYKTAYIRLSLPLPDTSVEDRALFLRFYVILYDIVSRYIQLRGWYLYDSLSPRESPEGMYIILSICLPKGQMTNAAIRRDLAAYVTSFDLHANMPALRSHFNSYLQQPTWKGRIREELHTSIVIVGNPAIVRLATEANMQRIIDSLEISLENVSYRIAKNIPY